MEQLQTVARYETRGGRYWYELQRDCHGIYSIRGDNSGGVMGSVSEAFALEDIALRVRQAREVDDINMRRVL